ncbi:hypothetical protein PILCRDRAFT_818160 [Piloderma croceum F 1598]|uniref:Uncharacterized protein n=1 Tax=Piloderma croceum (strain F 1598) TaxID=765440 RepID=A0A0C3C4M0_PILCF|nr:hypothetical protein PILCRDRAFT_818160 [Piloderma croceum F 1598]
MAANAKGVGLTGADAKAAEDRKEKERRREEKELRRAARAAGVRMPKPMADPSTSRVTLVIPPPASEGTPGFKKPGWATVSSTALAPPASSDTYQSVGGSKSGLTSVGSSSDTRPTGSSGGWASISSSSGSAPPPPEPASRSMASAPAFRTAGWTSLDTGSSQAPPRSHPPAPSGPISSSFAQAPPPPPQTYAPPPPAPSSSHHPPRALPSQSNQSNQWGSMPQPQKPPSSYSNANPSQNYGNNVRYPPGPPQPPSGPPPPRHPPPPGPSYNHPPLQSSSHNPRPGPGPGYQHPLPPAPQTQTPNPPPARSGWQQWNSSSGGPKRR